MQQSLPGRSHQQRLDALLLANEVRTKRSKFKQDLKAGKLDPLKYLNEPPEWMETMKVTDFLQALPRYGHTKVYQLLKRVHMSPAKTVGGLSQRQRQELVWLLR